MKRIILIIALCILHTFNYAQTFQPLTFEEMAAPYQALLKKNEPGNNIGRSLYEMRQLFPQLRYIGTDEKGDEYEDGYPENGVAQFFYFRQNRVVEECLIVQSDDSFAFDWYYELVNTFLTKYPTSIMVNKTHSKHFCYSNFSVHLVYITENNTNSALVVYRNGGFQTGITREIFMRQYY